MKSLSYNQQKWTRRHIDRHTEHGDGRSHTILQTVAHLHTSQTLHPGGKHPCLSEAFPREQLLLTNLGSSTSKQFSLNFLQMQ